MAAMQHGGMEYIGYDRHACAVYEGMPSSGFRVEPAPVVVPIRFCDGASLLPLETAYEGLSSWMFREDDFDAVSRTRRGRVFKMGHQLQPEVWSVTDHRRPELPTVVGGNGWLVQRAPLATYVRDTLHGFEGLTRKTVVLGWDPYPTSWQIVNVECNMVGTPVLWLKARHSLGGMPMLDDAKVDPSLRASLRDAMGKVDASVNRLGPVEVVDRCRDALSLIFGSHVGNLATDLGPALEMYGKKEGIDLKQNDIRWNCGRIVARLHSRGKPNELHRTAARALTDEDAELALACLRAVLMDFGLVS